MAKRYWEINKISGTELMAMRMMRGKTIQQMARLIKQDAHYLEFVEKNADGVPPYISSEYMDKLGITNSHMAQFKKILKGKTKTFSEDRTINIEVKKQVRKKCKNKCVKCGAKSKLHFHHIEHYSKGGQNTVENLVLLCASCHAEEHKGEQGYHMLKKMAEGE